MDLTSESINLINIQRRCEAYLKVLETFANTDNKSVQDIGQQT